MKEKIPNMESTERRSKKKKKVIIRSYSFNDLNAKIKSDYENQELTREHISVTFRDSPVLLYDRNFVIVLQIVVGILENVQQILYLSIQSFSISFVLVRYDKICRIMKSVLHASRSCFPIE